MRYFISISYNGAAFSGWQIQDNANSVQQELQNALSIYAQEPISITGAGRTDAGVNAKYCIAHFDTEREIEKNPEQFLYKLNAILPNTIVVLNCCRVKDDAHARFDATQREYKYYVHTSKDPFSNDFSCYFPFDLDIEKMNEAASHLLGERDFSSFEKVNGGNKTSICNLTFAKWEKIDETHFVFTVRANRFLRNMVRAIVGTLLEIGRGRRDVEWIDGVIASKNRSSAGQSVKGNALFLNYIEYPYELNWFL